MRANIEKMMTEVLDAANNVPDGQLIGVSEERCRDVLGGWISSVESAAVRNICARRSSVLA